MSNTPTAKDLEAGWQLEAERLLRAGDPIKQYQRGLITLDEFIALLAAIRLDEAQWTHPAATHPVHTAIAYSRLMAEGL